jgi:hypothetical protein
MSNSNSTELVTANLFRFAGYGLLLLAFSNFAEALIPPRFGQDAAWEFSALAKLVGTSPVPIIGLILIFYGESTARSAFGKNALKFLSWLSLLLSIFYVVMLLVGVSAAIRINNDNNTQANFALSEQTTRINKVREDIETKAKENLKKTSDADLLKFAESLEKQSPAIALNKSNPSELRKQLETELKGKLEAESLKKTNEVKGKVEEGQTKAFRQLIKQAAKSYFEAIVSAFVLFGIWSQTKWARTSTKRKKKGSKTPASLSDVASAPTFETDVSKSEDQE